LPFINIDRFVIFIVKQIQKSWVALGDEAQRAYLQRWTLVGRAKRLKMTRSPCYLQALRA